jgi:hypothetical protein
MPASCLVGRALGSGGLVLRPRLIVIAQIDKIKGHSHLQNRKMMSDLDFGSHALPSRKRLYEASRGSGSSRQSRENSCHHSLVSGRQSCWPQLRCRRFSTDRVPFLHLQPLQNMPSQSIVRSVNVYDPRQRLDIVPRDTVAVSRRYRSLRRILETAEGRERPPPATAGGRLSSTVTAPTCERAGVSGHPYPRSKEGSRGSAVRLFIVHSPGISRVPPQSQR